jgi:hypothetical protein
MISARLLTSKKSKTSSGWPNNLIDSKIQLTGLEGTRCEDKEGMNEGSHRCAKEQKTRGMSKQANEQGTK